MSTRLEMSPAEQQARRDYFASLCEDRDPVTITLPRRLMEAVVNGFYSAHFVDPQCSTYPLPVDAQCFYAHILSEIRKQDPNLQATFYSED